MLLKIVDPFTGDNGVLYPNFDMDFVKVMKFLCLRADIIIPNLTEACFLYYYEYKEKYNEDYIIKLIQKISETGTKILLLQELIIVRIQPGLWLLKMVYRGIINIA